MADPNRVNFGLSKLYYAVLTETLQSGVVTPSWGTPVAVPGAVSLTLEKEGAIEPFYADNITYYQASYNNGYTGSLEVAKVPDKMLEDIFGQTLTSTGVIAEYADVPSIPFALLYQVDGDADEEYYALYKCYAERPNIGSSTIENGQASPQTQTMDISAVPINAPNDAKLDKLVKLRTTPTTTTTVKNNWFSAVLTSF